MTLETNLLVALSTGQAYTLSDLAALTNARSDVAIWGAIQGLRQKGYDIQLLPVSEDPAVSTYRYHLNSHTEEPMTSTTTHFRLEPEFFGDIQGAVAAHASKLTREQGISRGRANVQAADYVARTRFDPPISGADLDHWLSVQRGRRRRPAPAYPVNVPGAHPTDTLEIGPEEGGLEIMQEADPLVGELCRRLAPMKPGDRWSIKTTGPEHARRIKGLMPQVARRLGWKRERMVGSPRILTYSTKTFDDRIRISRLR